MDMSVLDAALGAKKKPVAPGAEPVAEEAAEMDGAGPVLMQEYMDAQAAGDAAGAWTAFKSMVAQCGDQYESEE